MYKKPLIIALSISMIILCQSSWGEESNIKEQITAEIQKIKDKGEPTTIEELIPEEIPDEENGAFVYRKAFELIENLEKRYEKEWDNIPYEGRRFWGDEVSEEEKKKVSDLILYNSDFIKMYQLIEKASNMKCQFIRRKDYVEKGAELPFHHLSKLRSCVRLLAAKAKLEIEKGDSPENIVLSEPILVREDYPKINISEIEIREGKSSR